MIESKEIFVKMVLDMWNARVKQTGDLLNTLSDDQLFCEVAPAKNRGVYILGHLTAAHDQMFPLLDLGNPFYPEYKAIFIDHPDKAISDIPNITTLRKSYRNVNQLLSKSFESFHSEEWFRRHTSVSKSGFEKEPHRNKLNIILSRSNHLGYHFGQLILLK